MKTKINKFGIEIEGEFSDELRRKIDELEIGKWTSDGSIRRCDCPTGKRFPKGHSARLVEAEYVTKPLRYNEQGLEKAERLIELIDKYYRKGHFHYNKTMGMHIHLSFNKRRASELWSIEFVNFFVDRLENRFPGVYQKRTTQSTYCQEIKNEQEISQGFERYKAINFTSAYIKHGTIEFRIFPTDRPRRMRCYLDFLFKTVNAFIWKETLMLSKTYEFEVEGKRKISKVQTSIVKITEVSENEWNRKTRRQEPLEEEHEGVNDNRGADEFRYHEEISRDGIRNIPF